MELQIHGTRRSSELLACDKQAWLRLGQHRPVDTDADEAYLVESGCPYGHDDRRSLWASVADRWALQLIATPGLGEAELVGLANLVVARLRAEAG